MFRKISFLTASFSVLLLKLVYIAYALVDEFLESKQGIKFFFWETKI